MSGDSRIEITSIEKKPWETRHIGKPIYQITTRLVPNQGRYYYTQVDSSNTKLIDALEEEGYTTLIETVTLDIPTSNINTNTQSSKNIKEATEKDLRQLMVLAGKSFVKSRLHSMAGIVIADLMHEDWIKNCVTKEQADTVLIYQEYETIYGFIAFRVRNTIGDIVLIAVDPARRGEDIGKKLVVAACRSMKNLSIQIAVRTELSNTSAIRMYESCGFRFGSGAIYLGKWYD